MSPARVGFHASPLTWLLLHDAAKDLLKLRRLFLPVHPPTRPPGEGSVKEPARGSAGRQGSSVTALRS